MTTPEMPELPDLDKHLDAVLRASGSALKHYAMESNKAAMRAAALNIYRLGVEAGRKGYADLHAAALAVESRWIREGQHCVGGAPVSIFMLRQALGGLGPLPSPPAQEDKP